MTTADELRRAALSLPEAEERETWGHPTFRVRDKMFATLSDDGRSAGIKTTKEEQTALVAADPETFGVPAYVGRHEARAGSVAVGASRQGRIMATRWSLTIDCAQPARLARFWALALGYVEKPPPEGSVSWEEWFRQHGIPEQEWDQAAYLSDPDGVAPTLSLLWVPESKVVKNRLHLDVQVSGAASGRGRSGGRS